MRALLTRVRRKVASIRGNGSSVRRSWGWVALVLPVLLLVTQLAACGGSNHPTASGRGTISLVGQEEILGSISAQVGRHHAHASHIISSPVTQPPDYQRTSSPT